MKKYERTTYTAKSQKNYRLKYLMGFKRCSMCKSLCYIKDFSRDNSTIDGVNYKCKSCVCKYKQSVVDNIKISVPDFQACTGCKKNLPKDRFYKSVYNKSGLRSKCKTCTYELKKERFKTDIQFRIKDIISKRMREALRRYRKVSKPSVNSKFVEIVGCEPDTYITYIEGLFTDGMSWDNYGEWHIDHIIPCDSFDMSVEHEVQKCFHYTNTQPLWAVDNIKKSNKIQTTVS